MAELSLRERLQPALIDRLADDERFLTLFQIDAGRDELARLKLSDRQWLDILLAQGLRPASAAGASAAAASGEPPARENLLRLSLLAPAGRVSLAQLKSLTIKPPGAPGGIAVQDFCRIVTRNVPNDVVESTDHRAVSMRRLREYVLRDVAALLNSLNLEMDVDLSRYPRVRSSVLNYGMRSLAGQSATAVDPLRTAAAIEEAIRLFEPRLRKTRVTPEAQEGVEGHRLTFRIDAELWGQPAPQQLILRTRIEADTGHALVSDYAAG